MRRANHWLCGCVGLLAASGLAARAVAQQVSRAQLARGAPQEAHGAQQSRGAPDASSAQHASSAQQSRGAQDAERDTPTLEAGRRRWERLSPAEQSKARRDYERYKSLTEQERRDLAERARRLDKTRERILREMTPAVRTRLEKLDPKKRRELIEELVEGEAREIGRLVREQLPEPWVERLENAKPEDRARFLAEFKEKQADKTRRMIADLGRRLGLAPEEIARIEGLPEPERRQTVLVLRKQQTERDVEQRGLPPWVTRERWDAWRALTPKEFFEAMQQAQREHAQASGKLEAASSHDPARAPHEPRSNDPERQRATRELGEALRVQPEELLELAELPAVERSRQLLERRRRRALAVIERTRLVSRERLTELEGLPPRRLFEVLRQVLAPVHASGEKPRRDGPP